MYQSNDAFFKQILHKIYYIKRGAKKLEGQDLVSGGDKINRPACWAIAEIFS